jgi:hypothetical protein
MNYDVLLLGLGLDLIAISLLTYGIYYRRHHRRDLTLGFVGVNVGLFAVAWFVSSRPVGIGFGIGLFALLSVIRLRSTQITQEEIGYYFVAIVIWLVNGLTPDLHWGTTVTLTAVLVGVMYVADHPRFLTKYQRRVVTLKSVYRDEAKLRSALGAKLGGEVTNMVVLSVDYVHKKTVADVRFRPYTAVQLAAIETAEQAAHAAKAAAHAAKRAARAPEATTSVLEQPDDPLEEPEEPGDPFDEVAEPPYDIGEAGT